MASDFIYILSTLPLLEFDGTGAVGYGKFLDGVSGMLNDRERGLLEKLTLRDAENADRDTPALRKWDAWMGMMINISALWRGQRRKKEFSSDIVPAREVSPADASRFEAILQLPGIAEKQDAFEELQWNCLEELSCQEGFTFDALVLYALKLRLLEDRSRRGVEAGKAAFEKLVEERLAEADKNRISVEE